MEESPDRRNPFPVLLNRRQNHLQQGTVPWCRNLLFWQVPVYRRAPFRLSQPVCLFWLHLLPFLRQYGQASPSASCGSACLTVLCFLPARMSVFPPQQILRQVLPAGYRVFLLSALQTAEFLPEWRRTELSSILPWHHFLPGSYPFLSECHTFLHNHWLPL